MGVIIGKTVIVVETKFSLRCYLEMEDAHTCLLELSEDKDASFFAVFDGHGGHDVAKVSSRTLHKKIINNNSYRECSILHVTV